MPFAWAGSWSTAVKLVEKNREALSAIPNAYFDVSVTMKDDTEWESRSRVELAGTLAALKELVSIGQFAGELDFDKLTICMAS